MINRNALVGGLCFNRNALGGGSYQIRGIQNVGRGKNAGGGVHVHEHKRLPRTSDSLFVNICDQANPRHLTCQKPKVGRKFAFSRMRNCIFGAS